LVALDHELGELGSCDHNPEAAPATPTGVKQHAASPRKTSPSMGNFNCRQGVSVIVVAQGSTSRTVCSKNPFFGAVDDSMQVLNVRVCMVVVVLTPGG
jgi:hypothetical protein